MRLAHCVCNSEREILYPTSLIFTDEEILRLTNPTQPPVVMSKKAQKAVAYRARVESRGMKAVGRGPMETGLIGGV